MRVLLDEHLPEGLALELVGHDVNAVVGRGWAGIRNGGFLRRMSADYDVLITMGRGIEFQQPIAGWCIRSNPTMSSVDELPWRIQITFSPQA